jgi:hypothetical protein
MGLVCSPKMEVRTELSIKVANHRQWPHVHVHDDACVSDAFFVSFAEGWLTLPPDMPLHISLQSS